MADDNKNTVDPYRDVSKAEVEAWAARERERRRKWLEGPTEEEKHAYAARLRRWRRENDGAMDDEDVVEGRRFVDRMQADTARALIGAASRLAEAPYRIIGDVMRAGRLYEEEFFSPPRRRRRVRYSDDRD